MTPQTRGFGRRKAALIAWLFVAGGTSNLACYGGGDEVNLQGRLWISGLPKSPNATLTAFFIRNGTRPMGAIFQGTAYRGVHNLVRWEPRDGSHGTAGTLVLLADGARHKIRVETCRPSRGFDHCILMRGDPTGTRRYESRRRWALKRERNYGSTLEVMHHVADASRSGEVGLGAWLEPQVES